MSDSDGNGPSRFKYDGFHIEDKWPGLDVKDGVDVHHPTVKNLIKALEDDLDRLKGLQGTATKMGPGTVDHFKQHGLVTTAELGDWDVPQAMATVFQQAHMSLGSSYEKLVVQYEAALKVARAAVENIGKAEDASDIGKTET